MYTRFKIGDEMRKIASYFFDDVKRLKFGLLTLTMLAALGAAACGGKQESKKQTVETSPPPPPEPVFDRYWNDLARLLAGLDPLPGSVLDSLEKLPETERHRRVLQAEWNVKKQHLAKLEAFAESEFGDVRKLDRTVFYPFSGPDFITIHTLFPRAKKYVMFGLEQEGTPPDVFKLSRARYDYNLRNIQTALDDIMRLNFFMTLDMSVELHRAELSGVTPILMLLMALRENEVLDVKRFHLNSERRIVYLTDSSKIMQNPKDTSVTGVEIQFRKHKGKPIQTLQYFSFNAEDPALSRSKNLTEYLLALSPTTTYVKSASYLMHNAGFSIVRDIVLENSDFLMQDDTGLPWRMIDKNTFDVRLYGNYVTPIPIFRNYYQPDLVQAYQRDTTRKNVDFGLGYGNPTLTNFLTARRKAPRPVPAASKPDSAAQP